MSGNWLRWWKESGPNARADTHRIIIVLWQKANRFHINMVVHLKLHICQSVLASNLIAISSESCCCCCCCDFSVHCFSFIAGCILVYSVNSLHSSALHSFRCKMVALSRILTSFKKNSLFKLILTIFLNSPFYQRTFIIFIFLFHCKWAVVKYVFVLVFVFVAVVEKKSAEKMEKRTRI